MHCSAISLTLLLSLGSVGMLSLLWKGKTRTAQAGPTRIRSSRAAKTLLTPESGMARYRDCGVWGKERSDPDTESHHRRVLVYAYGSTPARTVPYGRCGGCPAGRTLTFHTRPVGQFSPWRRRPHIPRRSWTRIGLWPKLRAQPFRHIIPGAPYQHCRWPARSPCAGRVPCRRRTVLLQP